MLTVGKLPFVIHIATWITTYAYNISNMIVCTYKNNVKQEYRKKMIETPEWKAFLCDITWSYLDVSLKNGIM